MLLASVDGFLPFSCGRSVFIRSASLQRTRVLPNNCLLANSWSGRYGDRSGASAAPFVLAARHHPACAQRPAYTETPCTIISIRTECKVCARNFFFSSRRSATPVCWLRARARLVFAVHWDFASCPSGECTCLVRSNCACLSIASILLSSLTTSQRSYVACVRAFLDEVTHGVGIGSAGLWIGIECNLALHSHLHTQVYVVHDV